MPIVEQLIGAMGRVTTLSSVQTLPIPTNANRVILQAETNNVRFTLDGTDPNATGGQENGFLLLKNGIYEHDFHANNVIKIIEVTASAQLNYQFVYMHGVV